MTSVKYKESPKLCDFWADTLLMPSYGLGEIFEGDFEECAPTNSAHVDRGLSGASSVHRHGSKDPIAVSGNFNKLM